MQAVKRKVWFSCILIKKEWKQVILAIQSWSCPISQKILFKWVPQLFKEMACEKRNMALWGLVEPKIRAQESFTKSWSNGFSFIKQQNTQLFHVFLKINVYLFVWKAGERRERERDDRETDLPCAGLLFKWSQWPRTIQAEARNLELRQGFTQVLTFPDTLAGR